METMILQSKSNENMTLIAMLAKKQGVSVKYVNNLENKDEDTAFLDRMLKAREEGILNRTEKESFLSLLKKEQHNKNEKPLNSF